MCVKSVRIVQDTDNIRDDVRALVLFRSSGVSSSFFVGRIQPIQAVCDLGGMCSCFCWYIWLFGMFFGCILGCFCVGNVWLSLLCV